MVRFGHYGSTIPMSAELIEQLMEQMVFHNHDGIVAVDTETVSLEDKRLLGIGIAPSSRDGFWFPVWPEASPYLPMVLRLLADSSITKVYHHCMFDLDVLRAYYVDTSNIADTMLMANQLGLPLALRDLSYYGGVQSGKFPKLSKKDGLLGLPVETVVQKNCLDTMATYAAYEYMKDKVDVAAEASDMALVPVLLDMQSRGLRVDQDRVLELEKKYRQQEVQYRVLCEGMGFNPASPQQVGYALSDRGNILKVVRSRRSGKLTMPVDERALKSLDDPVASMVLLFRGSNKILSTYIRPLLGKTRAYTHFGMATATSRLSSSDMNLQNIPKRRGREIRTMFVPDADVFTSLDFCQQELRILAYKSNDRVMQGIFDAGGDPHSETAAILAIPRLMAKNTNFSMVYGGSDKVVMETAGIKSISAVRELKAKWNSSFREAADWLSSIKEYGVAHGKVQTIGGRWLLLGEDRDEEMAKRACNYLIQGSGAEITREAMMRCYRAGLDMRLQVHDELIFNGDVREELAKLDLGNIEPVRVPVDIRVISRWGE